VPQVGNHRTGIATVRNGYAFHRRSSCVSLPVYAERNTSLLVRVWLRLPIVRARPCGAAPPSGDGATNGKRGIQ